jgi:hypothetical protein
MFIRFYFCRIMKRCGTGVRKLIVAFVLIAVLRFGEGTGSYLGPVRGICDRFFFVSSVLSG